MTDGIEGDRMLAEVVASRAYTQGGGALGIGVGSAFLAAIPCAGMPVPAMIWGLLTLLPVVGGALALSGAWLAWSGLQAAPEEARLALTPSERSVPVMLGAAGSVLGTLAGLTGLINLLFTQFSRSI